MDMDSSITYQSEDSSSFQGYKEEVSNSSYGNREAESSECQDICPHDSVSNTSMDVTRPGGQVDSSGTGQQFKDNDDQSVVDSESEKESESESSLSGQSESDIAVQSESRKKRKRRKTKASDDVREEEIPPARK